MSPGLNVLLFGPLAELAGQREVVLSAPTPRTAGEAWSALVAVHPRLRGAEKSVRVAVNECYTVWSAEVADGDTVAFLPPVAGG